MKFSLWLACGHFLFLSALGPAVAQMRAEPTGIQEIPATKEHLKGLRTGGYVLYMRHAITDTSKPDAVPKVDLNNCATQRNLSEDGRKQAVALGRRIVSSGIPVTEVVYSPFCRTRETAQLAFRGTGFKLREEPRIAYPSNMTSEEKKPVLEITRQLVSAPVPAGTNRMLVGHAQNLADLLDLFVKPEGAVVILRPRGDGRFDYVASIPPAAWPDLLR